MSAGEYGTYWANRMANYSQQAQMDQQKQVLLGQLQANQHSATASSNSILANFINSGGAASGLLPPVVCAPKPEDEFGWLRRRVAEVSWRN